MDFNIYTDHVVSAQCQDIVVFDRNQQIVDVAVPSDCNVALKEAEKIKSIKTYLLNCHL